VGKGVEELSGLGSSKEDQNEGKGQWKAKKERG